MNRDNYPSRKGKPKLETWLLDQLIMNKINAILSNWKTTLAAIAAIATALSDGFQTTDFAAIATAVGLVLAKDADKSNSPSPSKTKLVD